MTKNSALLLVLFVSCLTCGVLSERVAKCLFIPSKSKDQVAGNMTLTQASANDKTKITVLIDGLVANSIHGFHIHQLGSLIEGCTAAKGHFNPKNKTHAGP